ncbi:crossover junction endodeoxyribonuclease RuvC [Lignipirellula cremea]|uniref:Crossover junction endodeoxyribonuclease RuvC n=1 Tax=Lignipirellula cremea TaxID=2528010 RepID=A0A518DMA9_9BACT|nr:crossover junction endodeoxyribonuclease RuvC [Lignipirellula cremea]QDU92978.1 Crossover junction endodeoxyribonuclease RuvC [Lignipirellula cremea]
MSDITKTVRVLGIDPGLNITGYGVVERKAGNFQLIEAGVVRGGKGTLAQRIRRIHEGVAEIVQSLAPEVVAIEDLYSHYERPKTAILMGHARGVICLAAAQADLHVENYAATQVKRMLTGNGRAPKSQMQMAVCREFHLAAAPDPPDVADALAVALCHLFFVSRAIQLPA